MNKLMLVLLSLTALSGCAVTGDRPDEFAAKVIVGTILKETGLGELAGVESSGSVRVKNGVFVRNARGDEIVLIPRSDTTIQVP